MNQTLEWKGKGFDPHGLDTSLSIGLVHKVERRLAGLVSESWGLRLCQCLTQLTNTPGRNAVGKFSWFWNTTVSDSPPERCTGTGKQCFNDGLAHVCGIWQLIEVLKRGRNRLVYEL